LSALNGQLASLLDIIQDADVDPTTQVLQTTQDRVAAARSLLDQWTQLKQTDLSALNRQLSSAGLPVIDLGTPARR
jgi:ABC-type phosphate transport system auxiliary subunit